MNREQMAQLVGETRTGWHEEAFKLWTNRDKVPIDHDVAIWLTRTMELVRECVNLENKLVELTGKNSVGDFIP